MIRLDKYLADAGKGTRSGVKKLIAAGRVSVNGVPVKDSGFKVQESDPVCIDGRPVRYAAYEYYLLNKPQGVISAVKDEAHGAVCVTDLIEDKLRKDLFPVGRLDRDTEGLLLITNDGDLCHRLLSPKNHVDKTYYAELDGPLTAEMIRRLETGVDIGDETPTRPCRIELSDSGEYAGKSPSERGGTSDLPVPKGDRRPPAAAACVQEPPAGTSCRRTPPAAAFCRITIHEGRYHQIRRMFETQGLTVTFLKRLTMGPLILDDALAPGQYRRLTEEELTALKAAGG